VRMGHRFASDTLPFCGDCIELPNVAARVGPRRATPRRRVGMVPLETARLWKYEGRGRLHYSHGGGNCQCEQDDSTGTPMLWSPLRRAEECGRIGKGPA
jgi:hypothetical protein